MLNWRGWLKSGSKIVHVLPALGEQMLFTLTGRQSVADHMRRAANLHALAASCFQVSAFLNVDAAVPGLFAASELDLNIHSVQRADQPCKDVFGDLGIQLCAPLQAPRSSSACFSTQCTSAGCVSPISSSLAGARDVAMLLVRRATAAAGHGHCCPLVLLNLCKALASVWSQPGAAAACCSAPGMHLTRILTRVAWVTARH